MKKRSLFWGILLGLLFLALVLAGAWWYISAQYKMEEAPAPSSVFVYLLYPSSGDEISVGDYVALSVHAFAPVKILYIEFFADGNSLGLVTANPEDASWTWQPLSPGLHVISAKATTEEGTVGNSAGVLVNVLGGDGNFQFPAEGGQTLDEIGAEFGISPLFMAAANPPFQTTEPLQDGQPVTIPIGSGQGAGSEIPPPPAAVVSEVFPGSVVIQWKFKPSEPVDQSYCYTSDGGGTWEKMPKEPFTFFESAENPYVQVISSDTLVIQMECWGWLGGVLQYLGEGKAETASLQPAETLVISGSGFIFTGTAQILSEIGGNIKTIPPPFALREPESVADCSAHGHPLLAPFICNTLMTAKVKEYIILEWEWTPEFCWGGDCPWMNEIDGYRVYQIDPVTKAEKYLAETTNPNNKITAIPLPWGAYCYGVRAYSNDPAYESSDMASYCPGDTAKTEQVVLLPSDWLTAGGMWMESGCGDIGAADDYLWENSHTGFGNLPGQVLVGAWIYDDEGCFKEGDYSAGVKFQLLLKVPPDAVIQKAILKFDKAYMSYGATGVAAVPPTTCVSAVGQAKQDWTWLVGGNHYYGDNILLSTAYNLPITSLSTNMAPAVDVSAAVKGWQVNPTKNHGFILTPTNAPHPLDDGSGECLSGLDAFQLEIHYFVP